MRMQTRWSEMTVTHSARGVPTYHAEVSHAGLHKYIVIRAGDSNFLAKKVHAQALQWNVAWEKQTATESRINRAFEAKEKRRLHTEGQKETAAERTTEARQLLEALGSILVANVELDPTLDWEKLKTKKPFQSDAPKKPELLPEPVPKKASRSPERFDWAYQFKLSFLDRLIPSRKKIKFAEVEQRFLDDLNVWRDACASLAAEHVSELDAHRNRSDRLQEEYVLAVVEWERERSLYYEDQGKQHGQVDELRRKYGSKSPEAVIEYCERVLSNSDYPACIPREFDLDFNPETGMLLLNCTLPAPEDLPKLAEVKYVQTTDTLSEKLLSDARSARLYDDVLYQIALRTVHELFQSDSVKALSTVVFNGMVTSTDRSTGNEATACILSVQTPRDVFLSINLAQVDPKACFRQLKGVGSSKLHSLTPIAPIMEILRDDRRFIPSYGVAERLSDGDNLAVMDWEDFEHLIREIFEKEFSSNGGEVKVTRASRDGGVDAIALDPDPIRGGKIVIQAKRYAYTVGVSAVRDLYGTVINEGASKGILVTTSDYGPDAYEFAKGKPLRLLSGSELLHLLGKHGVNAHINLGEARKNAQEKASRTRS
jgi:restriction system protein